MPLPNPDQGNNYDPMNPNGGGYDPTGGASPPPPPTGGTTPTTAPTATSSDWLSQLFGGGGGSGNLFGISPDAATRAMYMAGAWNDYNNSNQYMDLAGKYADQMNPFGSQRGYYQDKLKQLETDPNAYLASSPDYQAALKQGIGALDSSESAKGFAGSGHAADDTQAYGSQLAAQYLDRDRQSLMQMAGAQIGPQAAADLIKTGMIGSIFSKNNALTNLGKGLFPNTNNGNTVPGGGLKTQPQNVQDAVNAAIKASGPAGFEGAVQQLVKQGMSQQQAQQFVREGMTGQDNQGGGLDTQGTTPYGGGQQIYQMGDGGWYDSSNGNVYDSNGNLLYNAYGSGGDIGPPPDSGGYGGGADTYPYDFGGGNDFSSYFE